MPNMMMFLERVRILFLELCYKSKMIHIEDKKRRRIISKDVSGFSRMRAVWGQSSSQTIKTL